ncbi:hypothetical protein MAUB1S_11402 [Mycolicibacterium aubagnense]
MNGETIRVGNAPKGSTPFYRADGQVYFDGQDGRQMDFGHAFDQQRGYRVFFAFRDAFKECGASSMWGPDSLLQWVASLPPTDDVALQGFKRIASQQAAQCITLNREWERLGRPAGGVPMTPKGNA